MAVYFDDMTEQERLEGMVRIPQGFSRKCWIQAAIEGWDGGDEGSGKGAMCILVNLQLPLGSLFSLTDSASSLVCLQDKYPDGTIKATQIASTDLQKTGPMRYSLRRELEMEGILASGGFPNSASLLTWLGVMIALTFGRSACSQTGTTLQFIWL